MEAAEYTLDYKDVTSTIYHVNAVFDLKKDYSKLSEEHISEFESHWPLVDPKVRTVVATSKAWLQGLEQCFVNDIFQAHLLLRILQSTFNNRVDNVHTKTELSYADACT